MAFISAGGRVTSSGQLADNVVETADIADSAVTPVKLENGTRGDILYAGVGGVFGRLAAGASGAFLKANGAATDPTWEAPSSVPVGSLVPYAGASAPTGWLLADGSVVSQATYADLFAIIAHTYAADPGGGNFTLPDVRGRVPVGKSADTEFDALGETGGAKTHTLLATEMPAHTHPNLASLSSTTGTKTSTIQASLDFSSTPIDDANTVTGTTGGGGAHNNIQPYITLNYIIKF